MIGPMYNLPKMKVEDACREAIARYIKKMGRNPNRIYVSLKRTDVTANDFEIDGIKVSARKGVLPDDVWVGIEGL